MSEPTLEAQIDAATAYEALFVPALFGQWAPKVAEAARIQKPTAPLRNVSRVFAMAPCRGLSLSR